MPQRGSSPVRACCGDKGCYRTRNIRLLQAVPPRVARTLLAELAACEAGLRRDDFVKMVRGLAARDHGRLARQTLNEMERRQLAPSLTAYNALLRSHARSGNWAESTQLLLRMKQRELAPDGESYLLTLRSAAGAPGASKLAALLRQRRWPTEALGWDVLCPGHRQ